MFDSVTVLSTGQSKVESRACFSVVKCYLKKGKLIIVFLLKAGYFYVCVKSVFFKVDIYLIYATKLNVKKIG